MPRRHTSLSVKLATFWSYLPLKESFVFAPICSMFVNVLLAAGISQLKTQDRYVREGWFGFIVPLFPRQSANFSIRFFTFPRTRQGGPAPKRIGPRRPGFERFDLDRDPHILAHRAERPARVPSLLAPPPGRLHQGSSVKSRNLGQPRRLRFLVRVSVMIDEWRRSSLEYSLGC